MPRFTQPCEYTFVNLSKGTRAGSASTQPFRQSAPSSSSLSKPRAESAASRPAKLPKSNPLRPFTSNGVAVRPSSPALQPGGRKGSHHTTVASQVSAPLAPSPSLQPRNQAARRHQAGPSLLPSPPSASSVTPSDGPVPSSGLVSSPLRQSILPSSSAPVDHYLAAIDLNFSHGTGDDDLSRELKVKKLEDKIQATIDELRELEETRDRKRIELEDLRLRLAEAKAEPDDQNPLSYYEKRKFAWRWEIRSLAERFGVEKFRPCQEQGINALLDNRTVMFRLPTGFGKSLCFQIPALLRKGLTVVIMPYRSLMKDQAKKLARWGFVEEGFAKVLDSETPAAEAKEILRDISTKAGTLRLLMVTPERFQSLSFAAALNECYRQGHLKRFVVDEIHCVEMLGNGHRPDYMGASPVSAVGWRLREGRLADDLSALLQLANHLDKFLEVPLTGFSATLSKSVMDSVLKVMPRFRGCLNIRGSVSRVNLSYSVYLKPARERDAIETAVEWIARYHPSSTGIVYVNRVAAAKDYAAAISGRLGRKALIYHGKLEGHERDPCQDQWSLPEACIIVATSAFGMGIDRQDVDFVLHTSCPKSMEDYVQEAGRAGRGGQKADCVLFWGGGDVDFALKLLLIDHKEQSGRSVSLDEQRKRLQKLFEYVESGRCRTYTIAAYFDEANPKSCAPGGDSLCDVCRQGEGARAPLKAYADEVDRVLFEVRRAGPSGVTMVELAKALGNLGVDAKRLTAGMVARRELDALLKQGMRNSFIKYVEAKVPPQALPPLRLDPGLSQFQGAAVKGPSRGKELAYRGKAVAPGVDTAFGLGTPSRPATTLQPRPNKKRKGPKLPEPQRWRKHQRLELFSSSTGGSSSPVADGSSPTRPAGLRNLPTVDYTLAPPLFQTPRRSKAPRSKAPGDQSHSPSRAVRLSITSDPESFVEVDILTSSPSLVSSSPRYRPLPPVPTLARNSRTVISLISSSPTPAPRPRDASFRLLEAGTIDSSDD